MVNWEIKSETVNVIDNDNHTVNLMKLEDAIKLAQETDEDVVLISTKGDIPVVSICDYSKFLYEKQKKEKERKKKSRENNKDTKEIKINDSIAEHDLKIKAANVDRLLKEGNKVKLSIRYKGRQMRFINEGPAKLAVLEQLVTYNHKITKTPSIEGQTVSMIIEPIK